MNPIDTPRPTAAPQRAAQLVAVLSLALATGCGDANQTATGAPTDIYVVERSDMRITVRESGEIKALRETRVRSQVEGQATIIYLIPEGTTVQTGDKLAELDASELEDREANQAISVSRAKANLVASQKDLEILGKELAVLEGSARSKLEIAQLELEKFMGSLPREKEASSATSAEGGGDVIPAAAANSGPSEDSGGPSVSSTDLSELGITADQIGTNHETLARLRNLVAGTKFRNLDETLVELLGAENLDRDMGDMAQQVLNQIDKIRLARADLKLKEDTLGHSSRLAGKGYITRNELDRHQLDYDSQRSRVTLAWNELDLLINYGLRSSFIDLQLKVNNAEIEVDKTLASNEARRAREEESLKADEQEYNLAKDRLDNLREQIANAVITAPNPGLVVYSDVGDGRRSSEVVEEGMSVRQRQTLIILPDTTTMIAELKVPESDIDKIIKGQYASVFIDSAPEQAFPARVSRVSPLADSGSRWSNNNKKVYKTEVTLDGGTDVLRPSMSATVEILIGVVKDVINVPLPAVRREGAVHYVWKVTRGDPIPVRVEIGRSNVSHVEITSGLEVGDRVYMSRPTGVTIPEFDQPTASQNAPPPPSAEEVRASREDNERGPDSEDGGTRRRGATSPAFTEYLALLRSKLPQFKEKLEGSAAFRNLRDPEISAAVEADPELKAARDKMMEGFQGMRGRRGGDREGGGREGGGREGGGRGNRGGGERGDGERGGNE